MSKLIQTAVAAVFLSAAAEAETFKEAFPTQIIDDRTARMQLLHGTVALAGADAQVVVPDGYYLLGPADARHVLETVWANPPQPGTLGLMFPDTMTPFGLSDWAVTFEFDPMGYVSDADAESYDYVDLLRQMQADTLAENPARTKAGFPEVTLLGWAEPPRYDKEDRKLIWAKRLSFDHSPTETLNYNIRALGRKGVLVVNFIATSDQLAEIKAAAPAVSQAVSFTSGNTYADFLPDVDTVAAVGIGGLIAGKVLSSTGILALGLLFVKKAGIFVVIGLAWLFRLVKKSMGDKTGGAGSA